MASLNELFMFLLSPYPLLVISLLAGFRTIFSSSCFCPLFFNFQVVGLAVVGKYFGLQPRPGCHVFDIRSGHPLISRLVFYFSLLLLFYFRISLIGNVFSVLFLLWLFIACHIYLLPSTAPGISVLQGILKFPVRSLALGNAILWATFFLHLFLRFRFVFQVMVFLYSHSFPLDTVSAFGFSGFVFLSN